MKSHSDTKLHASAVCVAFYFSRVECYVLIKFCLGVKKGGGGVRGLCNVKIFITNTLHFCFLLCPGGDKRTEIALLIRICMSVLISVWHHGLQGW